ncbi:HDOD domain-containing protein [Pseudomonas sp. REST10]|uniref:HDOD domain-containing protein n=1 Tax=Pseudomonas sp. REST10 TaxID=2512235 RepID=UPI00240DECB0|nr:HDOD domain-containing protein [Pseudomonas sp. REST10]WFC61710.1 HDOD domain-containing protein [Pseudomonas sp. REST10]
MPTTTDTLRLALLNRFLKGEAKIPQMPEAAVRIRKLLDDPHTSQEQLARVINGDPPLAAYLMQFSAAPLLRGNRPCTSLRDLLGRLGTRQLADLVLGFSLQHLFTSDDAALQQAFRTRWRNARERAAYCAVLAQTVGFSMDDAMLGGLLQDIGSLPLLSELEHWPELPRDSDSLNALCEQLSGDIGALILTRWQLPSAVIECARLHGQWQREHERSADLADLVLLASALQSGSTPDGLLPAQVKLGLERPLEELRAELAEGLKLWKRLLA